MKKLLFLIFIVAFITNLIWENVQAPLYEGFQSFTQHFLFCAIASIVDGAVIVVFLGSLTAIAFETFALKNETWNYKESMPLVFGLGLMPLIQLSILSIVSIYLVKFILVQQRQ